MRRQSAAKPLKGVCVRHSPAKGKLVVISGPSGVGKGTLVGKILGRVPNIFLSVSATTRRPRAAEEDGVNYYFLSPEEFDGEMAADAFLEWANIYGDRYGTPKAPIESALDEGKLVILEIDVQGAMQVWEKLERGATYIFVMPPSLEELAERLKGRKTETDESQKRRIEIARQEMALADKYDYVVINDDLERAAAELIDILRHRILKEG